MTRILAGVLIVGACGCALTSRGQALSVRYFDPEPPPARVGSASTQAQSSRPALRLGRVRGAPYLHDRIAYRKSEYELGFYDDREWTERPEEYVRRALVRKLFEERGFERMAGGRAPTLNVDVLAFEEVRTPRLHGARVEVRYEIRRGEAVVDEGTIAVERAVPGHRFEDVVAAVSEALDEVTDRIANLVSSLR